VKLSKKIESTGKDNSDTKTKRMTFSKSLKDLDKKLETSKTNLKTCTTSQILMMKPKSKKDSEERKNILMKSKD